jgi:hypothetical protein
MISGGMVSPCVRTRKVLCGLLSFFYRAALWRDVRLQHILYDFRRRAFGYTRHIRIPQMKELS